MIKITILFIKKGEEPRVMKEFSIIQNYPGMLVLSGENDSVPEEITIMPVYCEISDNKLTDAGLDLVDVVYDDGSFVELMQDDDDDDDESEDHRPIMRFRRLNDTTYMLIDKNFNL